MRRYVHGESLDPDVACRVLAQVKLWPTCFERLTRADDGRRVHNGKRVSLSEIEKSLPSCEGGIGLLGRAQ